MSPDPMSPEEIALRAIPLPEGMRLWAVKNPSFHEDVVLFKNSHDSQYFAYLLAHTHNKTFTYGFAVPRTNIQEFVLSEVVPKFQAHLAEVKKENTDAAV